MASKIYETKDYSRFDSHDLNRTIDKKLDSYKRLKRSMQINGWLDDLPMAVTLKKDGKFKIKRGHHRFCVAQELGIAVKYIIDNSGITFSEIERSVTPWKLKHYLQTYVRQGLADYIQVKEYCDKYGIALMPAISMLGGQSACSGNKDPQFKDGVYKIKDSKHAEAVGEIILHMKECGIEWATITPIVRTLSKIIRVPEIDVPALKKKIELHRALILKQPNIEGYQMMFEEIYNRGNHKRIPVSFLANEEARKRRILDK